MTAVERARALVGTPFRIGGRDPAFGLDCVGLAAGSLGVEAPAGYSVRTGDAATVARGLAAAGLRRVETAQAGDLLVLRTGPGQLHLAIRSEFGVIHADARTRRVVERPDMPWPVASIWRA